MWRVLGLLVLVVVLLGALFGYQAWRARHHLLLARSDAQALQAHLESGDLTAARHSATALQDATEHAHANTGNWLWAVAAHLPFVGRDIDAVRTATDGLDTIAQRALPTLIDLAGKVDDGSLRPHHGRLPLPQIAALAPQVRRAAGVVDQPASALDRIDLAGLSSTVATPLAQLRDHVDTARSALDTVARVLSVLPSAAGASGPRNYLLLFQNNAEVRATGGMPGSWAVLHAAHGRLSMTAQGTAGDLDNTPPPKSPVPATATEKALYGSDLGTQLRDANFNPNFPRFAAMAAGLVGQYAHTSFDGVFAVDPVALSYLLRGTGPVRLDPSTTLTSADAVDVLLNRVYLDRSPAAQDTLFATAARKIFEAVTTGGGNQLTMVRALAQGVEERRVLAWSSDPKLAAVIDHHAVAGALTDPSAPPQVGVFLDDATATKLDYYLHRHASVHASRCGNGRQHVNVDVVLHSSVPAKQRLPLSVTGPGLYAPPKVMTINVRVITPVGGSVDDLRQDGKEVTVAGGSVDQREVAVLPVTLRPGQTVRLHAALSFPRSARGSVQLTTTPGLTPTPDPVTMADLCA